MTRLEQLTIVLSKLNELHNNYLMAKNIRDKRGRDTAIKKAKNDIAYYSAFIPDDIMELFNSQVGANSLNYQHAADISECIDILNKLIHDEKPKEF